MKAHPSPGIADPFCRGEKSFAPAILRRPLLVILRSLRRRIQPAPSLSFPRRRESRFIFQVQHLVQENLCRGPVAQALARGILVVLKHLCKPFLRQCGEVGLAGQAPSQPADGVLHSALLPGRMGIAEEGLDAQIVQLMMAGKLGSVVEGHRPAHFGRELSQHLGHGVGYAASLRLLPTPTRCGQPPATPDPNPLRPASGYSRPQTAAAGLRLLPPPTRCGRPPATPAPNPLRPASGYSRPQPAAAGLRLLPPPTRCGQPPAAPAPNPLRPASGYSRPQPAAASLRLLPTPTRCGQPPATPAPQPVIPANAGISSPGRPYLVGCSPFVASLSSPVRGEALEPNERAGNAQSISRTMKAHPSHGTLRTPSVGAKNLSPRPFLGARFLSF